MSSTGTVVLLEKLFSDLHTFKMSMKIITHQFFLFFLTLACNVKLIRLINNNKLYQKHFLFLFLNQKQNPMLLLTENLSPWHLGNYTFLREMKTYAEINFLAFWLSKIVLILNFYPLRAHRLFEKFLHTFIYFHSCKHPYHFNQSAHYQIMKRQWENGLLLTSCL